MVVGGVRFPTRTRSRRGLAGLGEAGLGAARRGLAGQGMGHLMVLAR